MKRTPVDTAPRAFYIAIYEPIDCRADFTIEDDFTHLQGWIQLKKPSTFSRRFFLNCFDNNDTVSNSFIWFHSKKRNY